ncbi:MAG: glycosyltransferase family 9 protein [Ignavibacteria bacterium]|nr:glycosyltransferase family 9 protein [Ignavibacteria bacterium]
MKKFTQSLFYFYLRAFNRKKLRNVSVPIINPDVKCALVLLPDDPVLINHLKKFTPQFKKHIESITFVINESYTPLFKDKIPITAVVYNSGHRSKFDTPSQQLINQLRMKSYDLVIDLNISDSYFHYYLMHKIKCDRKLGFLKKNSDLFNNLQLRTSENANFEGVYESFFKFLFL